MLEQILGNGWKKYLGKAGSVGLSSLLFLQISRHINQSGCTHVEMLGQNA